MSPLLLTFLTFATLTVTYIAPFTEAGFGNGYSYQKPASSGSGGHHFSTLPTVRPLPPVPDLPALKFFSPKPTPGPTSKIITQSLLQLHPPASSAKLITTQYLPPRASYPRVEQNYQAPSLLPPSIFPSLHSLAPSAPTVPSAPSAAPIYSGPANRAPQTFTPTAPTNFAAQAPSTAAAPPLRIPFGKTAVISFPQLPSGGSGVSAPGNVDFYEVNGRQLKQYAVVEIIDNDIEQNPLLPFAHAPFFDGYRARQFDPLLSRQQQQRSSVAVSNPGDAVALGSGGLGFIRLANGNVYLGSGSLGYISSQQHSQSLTEARTRSGAPQPDALHFGHGPLGGTPITIRIK
uniref:DUF4774 domain-containing protein n=1 Tax=Glossina pallidipes TaxID=7398 RepID=A0A1A9ZCU4_GLOPL